MRMSIQAELDVFFGHLQDRSQLVHTVSEQAFAQARAKLSLTAIPSLNDWLVARAEQYGFVPRWCRLRLVAADASTMRFGLRASHVKRAALFYPKAEGAGPPPVGLARMLRMYVAQQCFGLSDEGMEDAIYDSQAIRGFVGIDLNRESTPDATTLLKFRRLLENNELTRKIFETINGHLAAKGLMMREGTIVDATLIAASPSTKNKDKERDPEMHQSKKGNDWHFGARTAPPLRAGIGAGESTRFGIITFPPPVNFH